MKKEEDKRKIQVWKLCVRILVWKFGTLVWILVWKLFVYRTLCKDTCLEVWNISLV